MTYDYVFICAMKEEADYIINCFKMDKIDDSTYVSTSYKMLLVICGIGLSNVVKNLSHRDFGGATIINVGYVGSPLYNVGDVVQCSVVKRLFEPQKVKNLNYTYSLPVLVSEMPKTTLLTADDFVEDTEVSIKDCVVDMEGYYIASMFPNMHIVKVVSDNLSMKAFDDNTRSDLLSKAWKNLLDNLKAVIA